MIDVPERLGGGFLFVIENHIWRSDTWLGRARPIFTAVVAAPQIAIGLDRAYVRYAQGSLAAFDPKTGTALDLGPLPATPHWGKLVAIDAWRAVAIADLRGALFTLDAGNSWQALSLPIEPNDIVALGKSVAVAGRDKDNRTTWWKVPFDGPAELLESGPVSPHPDSLESDEPVDRTARVFGRRPLVTALKDGWPRGDGTALVARDGAMARVRLADGVLVETIAGVFARKPARCHPLSLSTTHAPDAFGFVCGAPDGETEIYAFEPRGPRMRLLRRFAEPRQVLSFGNGALAVRGPCAGLAHDSAVGDRLSWCVMPKDGLWKEVAVHGEGIERARFVILADGSTAIVRPPASGDLSTARLTVVSDSVETDRPIRFPSVPALAARVLRFGVWMDGFEERGDGAVGGWIDAGGSVVGIEIAPNGEARVGEYIQNAGAPIVSGRWGFGWTASRGGFETTDGGMTWAKEIALPTPIAEPTAEREHVCGPLGCVVAGWLRIGWGGPRGSPDPAFPPASSIAGGGRAALQLQCERGPAGMARIGAREVGVPSTVTWGGMTDFGTFAGFIGPPIPRGNVGFVADAAHGFEHTLRAEPLGRVYAWGPQSEDWDGLAHWQIRWNSPWSTVPEARASAVSAAPFSSLDSVRRGLGIGPSVPTTWSVISDTDGDHALLIARHNQNIATADLWSLEAGRAPSPIRSPDGRVFPEVHAAARVRGFWLFATPEEPGEAAATVIWRIDGGSATELGRVPRLGEGSPHRVRFARSTEGRNLAIAIDGQPDVRRHTAVWGVDVDLDSGPRGEPFLLGPLDVSSGASSACPSDDSSWELEVPYPRSIEVSDSAGSPWAIRGGAARVHTGPEGTCLDGITGTVEASDAARLRTLPRIASAPVGMDRDGHRAIATSVFAQGAETELSCWPGAR